jgi:arsenite methyltransferase
MTTETVRIEDGLKSAPYESPALRAVTGPTLRPGGLDLTRHALSLCRLPATARVLDVGCGLGATVNWLRRRKRMAAFGLDRSRVMLAGERHPYPGLPLVQADAGRLPFAAGRFDLVLAECVLSLLDAPDIMLAECRRVTAPGARLVLTDIYARPAPGMPGHPAPPTGGCLARARRRETLVALTAAAGFETELWQDHTDRLRRLAADLVWAHGSLAGFFPAAGRTAAVCRAGFGLMICRRKDS